MEKTYLEYSDSDSDSNSSDSYKQKQNYFIYTSNVDGHFEKAGFLEKDIETIHGDYIHWQCFDKTCIQEVIKAPDSFRFQIDKETLQGLDVGLPDTLPEEKKN